MHAKVLATLAPTSSSSLAGASGEVAGVLPLKQVNAVERLWLRGSRWLGNGGGPRLSPAALNRLVGGAERLATLFETLLGNASHSHGYLIARRTD